MNKPVFAWTFFLCLLALTQVTWAQQADDTLTATPNRPSLSNGAATTQLGALELEYGFNHTAQDGGSHTRDFGTSLRYGLTRRADLFWNFSEYQSSIDQGVRLNGTGDNWLGGRYRFLDQSKSRPAMAVLYLCKVPTASPSKGLGSGYADHQFVLILSKDLGPIHIDFNQFALVSGTSHGHDLTGVASFSTSGPIYKKLGWNVETYGGRNGSLHFASQMTALTLAVRPRLVLDAEIDNGLTPGSPHSRLAAGFTYTLGRIRK
jgi:hypothetical protein